MKSFNWGSDDDDSRGTEGAKGNRDVDALGQLWLLKREGSSAFVIREFSNSRIRELSMELEFSYAKLRQISITRIRAWQNKLNISPLKGKLVVQLNKLLSQVSIILQHEKGQPSSFPPADISCDFTGE